MRSPSGQKHSRYVVTSPRRTVTQGCLPVERRRTVAWNHRESLDGQLLHLTAKDVGQLRVLVHLPASDVHRNPPHRGQDPGPPGHLGAVDVVIKEYDGTVHAVGGGYGHASSTPRAHTHPGML